jgi:hypothetical protein
MFAYKAGSLYWGLNGTWYPTGANPYTGTNPVFTGIGLCCPAMSGYYNIKDQINFGQGGQTGLVYDATSGGRFKYTPPSGFKALCTANLPASTIKNGSSYFMPVLYSGSASAQAPAVPFSPDLVWIKDRTSAVSAAVVDSVRGATVAMQMDSFTGGESIISGLSFNTNSFSVPANTSQVSTSADSFVGWSWKKGATPGFDIQLATTDALGNLSINHSLGAVPTFAIFKPRSGAGNLQALVYHQVIGSNKWATFVSLTVNASPGFGSTISSTQFLNVACHGPTQPYLVYLWTDIAGFSKFGSYTGNGSADGPFVYCGFKPRFVMVKNISAATYWVMRDSVRDDQNYGTSKKLAANANYSESDTGNLGQNNDLVIDYLSNGFKVRDTNTGTNTSGSTYIFAAFAEAPFKYATAR